MGSALAQNKFAKIVVHFERRDDGGLRAYSEDVPGFVLSHSDADAVMADVTPALETILSAMVAAPVRVDPLHDLRGRLEAAGVLDSFCPAFCKQEYVGHLVN